MVTAPPLACTVRACGLFLERRGQAFQCARHHTYDIARSAYLNLLQPHDRKSATPGDSAGALEARARLLAAGIGRAVLGGVIAHVAALAPAGGVVVDLGSGTGDALGLLHDQADVTAVGIDLSAAAAEQAARRFPAVTWLVANADRRLPLLDRCVDVVLSIHGRRNPSECARVLAADGSLIVAVPAADDLIELRALVLGQAIARDRTETLAEEHDAQFSVVDRGSLREQHHLDARQLTDVLRSTYRGERRAKLHALDTVQNLDVTLASDVVVFKRRSSF